jgi:uncharacterized membrane protein SpoIIM required for sporulation
MPNKAAGLIVGNSILFPGTFSRGVSILKGGRDGLKIVFGLVPVFLIAAFLESFVTRYDKMPLGISLSILAGSLFFITWYFIIYPMRLHKKMEDVLQGQRNHNQPQNFTEWLNKKLNSERSGI